MSDCKLKMIRTLNDLEEAAAEGMETIYPDTPCLKVGLGTCGRAAGATQVYEASQEAVANQNAGIRVSGTACVGLCQYEPLVDVYIPGHSRVLYGGISPDDVENLIQAANNAEVCEEKAIARLDEEKNLLTDQNRVLAADQPLTAVDTFDENKFYGRQRKLALRNCGIIDPSSIKEYIARGGYRALYHALTECQPEEIIRMVTDSGLRGRGGGGFRTGWKWESSAETEADTRYIVCNADEGDPGAYMDRSVVEGDPHSVIEGMMIGARAIGAEEGFVYIRMEYPLARRHLQVAIEQARECGLLGDNIFGTDFNFDIRIARGGGAFVCGESSALMESLEGKVGEPHAKHIHTSESGLWDQPTVLNNVETWANVPLIIEKGADWFSSIGSENSTGTKVFSLVGQVNRTGLVEVPMGITLREVIEDIGGGVPEGKEFKAVQTGGPSGGCIPAEHLDLPVDFDRLSEVGSMMGSGGMVVMDEDSCMVDVARYFLDFLRDESCGKCTPCREGNQRMYEILDKICNGEASEQDLELLEEVAETTRKTSLCDLGKSATNPVLSTIEYFRDEYEAHIEDKRCPAGVCRALITFSIDPGTCICCGRCAEEC
ncbi:MAG: NADH-ubiquinone oxidoreductase-F iron-sulfur binding region domain-containing protein, partial [Planctomycetota bacterium]